MTKETLGREHRIHVSPAPRYFFGTLMGWEVDIISFNPCVESKTNACGRLKTEEEAIQAGIEYVEELLCRMTENTALNALYRQYEDEKRRLELYGHVSSLTYEEWLEIKKLNKDK